MEADTLHIDWDNAIPLCAVDNSKERGHGGFNEIIPGLFLTCESTAEQRGMLLLRHVVLVLTMNGEEHKPRYAIGEMDWDAVPRMGRMVHKACASRDEFMTEIKQELKQLRPKEADVEKNRLFVRSVPADDSPIYDMSEHFDEMCNLIELVLVARQHAANTGGSNVQLPAVCVHCVAGVSRSATIVIAYLMKRSKAPLETVVNFVRAARNVVSPNTGFMKQLSHWHAVQYSRVKDADSLQVAVASILREPEKVLSRMGDFYSQSLLMPQLAPERQLFGSFLHELIRAKAVTEEDIAALLVSTIVEHIVDDDFVDSPKLLPFAACIRASIEEHVPRVILAMSPSVPRPCTYRCTDEYDGIILRTLIHRDHVDPWVASEAAVRYLRAAHESRKDSKGFVVFDDAEATRHVQLPCVVTFPLLELLARVAEGFVPYVEWSTVEGGTDAQVALKLKWFMTARSDGSLGCGGTDNASWTTLGSYLGFMSVDIEAVVWQAGDASTPDELQAHVSRWIAAHVDSAVQQAAPWFAACCEAKGLSALRTYASVWPPSSERQEWLAQRVASIRKAFAQKPQTDP